MQYHIFTDSNNIRNRDMKMKCSCKSCVTQANVKAVEDNINTINGSNLIQKICSNRCDANTYFDKVLDFLPELEIMMNHSEYDTLRKNVCSTLPNNITSGNIKAFENKINETPIDSNTKERLLESVNNVKQYDRILNNNRNLSKRFNFEKIISRYGKNDNYNCVTELCEMIDTYNLPMEAKLNIALENITYSMFLKGRFNGLETEDISNIIIEYYLGSNCIITDKCMDKVKSILESNLFIDSNVKNTYINILESSKDDFSKKLSKIADKCDDPDNKKFILNVKEIKTEKQASVYIDTALNRINKGVSKNDAECIIDSILIIPLIGYVSGRFIQYELLLKAKFKKAKTKLDSEIIDDVDNIINISDYSDSDLVEFEQSFNLEAACNFINKFIGSDNDYNEDIAKLLESEQYADSEDIKDLLRKFNAEQDKSIGKFKNLLSRIYKKSPRAIIDSTPNFFSIIRVVFILGTFTFPVIGPILGVVAAFIDHLISMDINRKQAERIIRALDDERELVKKKIDKGGDKKEELEKYLKCLETCTRKVEAFRDNITDEEMKDRKSTLDNDNDFDDFDFSFEDCRSLFVQMDAINSILEAAQNGSEEKILDFVNTISEEDIADILMVFKRCPDLVDFDKIQEVTNNRYKKGEYKILQESNKFYNSEFNTPVYEEVNVLDDLLFEKCVVDEILNPINEGVNFSTMKLAMQNVKKKFKDLSTKEKQVCQTVDVNMSQFMKNTEKALTSDRREALIKGSMIPSFSKCLKSAMVVGGTAVVNPVLGMITALGMIGCSKKLNNRERQLIYDEIETELKVVDKQIQIAENDGDMNQYRFLLQYQKKLERERQRIKYGLKVSGRDVPTSSAGRRDTY